MTGVPFAVSRWSPTMRRLLKPACPTAPGVKWMTPLRPVVAIASSSRKSRLVGRDAGAEMMSTPTTAGRADVRVVGEHLAAD